MKLLDHGYLELVEHWGSDERIIESARMSTDGAFRGWGTPEAPGDEKLLKYLWDNKHATPFEMCGLTVEVKAPIMVFREWHRHRVPFGYNELSARYTPLPNENYVPSVERLLMKSTKNKQAGVAKGAAELTERNAQAWLRRLEYTYELSQQVYEEGLDIGVPKELARLPVPVGRYSKMRATGNLRGWLAFLKLRAAPQAQWEIRQFALAIGDTIEALFPRTYEVARESFQVSRYAQYEKALRALAKMSDPNVAIIAKEALK